MNTSLLFGALLVVAAFGVLWWSFAGARGEGGAVDLRNDTTRDSRELLLREAASDRAVQPFLERVGTRLRGYLPVQRVRELDKNVKQMGDPAWTVERVIAMKLLLSLTFFLLFMFRFVGNPTFINFLLFVGSTAFGFFAPNGIVDNRRNARKLLIRNSVSDTIDQLNVMVRAGLGIDAALTRVTEYNSGPLADEFARALQEMRFGLTRNVALANLAERTDVNELRGFVAALSNADRLGVSVSQTLKVQAEDLRDRRRQSAEEQAMKLPVKILFPTVFCIMPALFIVLLGPAAIRIFDQF